MAAAVSRATKCHDLAEKNTGGKQISLHDVLQLVESILSLQYLPQFETVATTMFFSSVCESETLTSTMLFSLWSQVCDSLSVMLVQPIVGLR